ncbi:MAG: CPBP family intramembrane glutamic endopeptidase [Candidatus Hermodarchaeota archaeon]
MDEKELQNTDKKQKPNKSNWLFCPVCGKNLPKIQNLKYCTKCGIDVNYIKEHKRLPPPRTTNPYKSQVSYPQYQALPIYYGPPKISDEELIDNKNHKLWGTFYSIGIPLLAFLFMNIILGGFLTFITYITRDIDILYDLISNSYFISFASLFELIFILVPVIYVRKYLKNPSLKNGLILLGFTSRGYDRRRISKEVLIGMSFALIGVALVLSTSILMEILIEIIFRVEIVQESDEITGAILPTDIPSLIIFSIVMILVIGTSEEILFRGFMQKGLDRSLGNKWGIIVSAFIFSMIHLISIFFFSLESPLLFLISFLLSFLPYFAISLMLGWLFYWRNENLIANMICHGFYDAITIILAYLVYVVF